MKPPPAAAAPFWREKPLEAMSDAEWESLCDGCARCCLVKLDDEETGTIHYTDVGCALLDAGACRCRDYGNRQAQVPDCVRLTPENIRDLAWMPPTCAYRLVAEGRDLYWWHPLVSGDPRRCTRRGSRCEAGLPAPKTTYSMPQLLDHIVQWPRSRRSRLRAVAARASGA